MTVRNGCSEILKKNINGDRMRLGKGEWGEMMNMCENKIYCSNLFDFTLCNILCGILLSLSAFLTGCSDKETEDKITGDTVWIRCTEEIVQQCVGSDVTIRGIAEQDKWGVSVCGIYLRNSNLDVPREEMILIDATGRLISAEGVLQIRPYCFDPNVSWIKATSGEEDYRLKTYKTSRSTNWLKNTDVNWLRDTLWIRGKPKILRQNIGQQIYIRGTSKNVSGGASIGNIYIDGLKKWPAEAEGKLVDGRGILENTIEHHSIDNKNTSKTNSEVKYFLLKHARWKMVDKIKNARWKIAKKIELNEYSAQQIKKEVLNFVNVIQNAINEEEEKEELLYLSDWLNWERSKYISDEKETPLSWGFRAKEEISGKDIPVSDLEFYDSGIVIEIFIRCKIKGQQDESTFQFKLISHNNIKILMRI